MRYNTKMKILWVFYGAITLFFGFAFAISIFFRRSDINIVPMCCIFLIFCAVFVCKAGHVWNYLHPDPLTVYPSD